METTWEYPRYDEDGVEILSYENSWRGDFPQTIEGADCFAPSAFLNPTDNKIVLVLTEQEFLQMFSALYVGAEFAYPQNYLQIIANFLKGLHCPPEVDEDGGCVNFKPYASFLQYEPQNPFNEPDLTPPDYLVPPFHFNNDLAYPELLGYTATDVMVATDAIPLLGGWDDLLGLNFPTIKLHVVGEGQIELDLLSVVAGGYAIIKIGSPPNILDLIDGIIETGVTIVDLNQDATSVPIESDLVIAEEIPIDAPDGTDVYIVFVPKIDASIDLYGMGGGIRHIGLCGLESDSMSFVEDIRYQDDMLQKRIGGVWADVIDWEGYRDGVVNAIESVSDAAAAAQTTAENAAIDAANAQDTANSAAAAAAAAQSTANGAVSVNNSQNTAITAINSAVDILEAAVDLLADSAVDHEARLDDIDLSIAQHNLDIDAMQLQLEAAFEFIAAMPEPFRLDYDFAAMEFESNWILTFGTQVSGQGLLSEDIGSSQQYIRILQDVQTSATGQGNVYMAKIAVQWDSGIGDAIKAGIFGTNPPDVVILQRNTLSEFIIYVWRFLGNDAANFGIELHCDSGDSFKVRAMSVYGFGVPNPI